MYLSYVVCYTHVFACTHTTPLHKYLSIVIISFLYQSAVNKMTLPNMVIVFSPTLQLPAHFLHILYQHAHNLFGDVELTRFVVTNNRSVIVAYAGKTWHRVHSRYSEWQGTDQVSLYPSCKISMTFDLLHVFIC